MVDIFSKYQNALKDISLVHSVGYVHSVIGLTIYVKNLIGKIGDLCFVMVDDEKSVLAEIVGFEDNITILISLSHIDGIASGMKVKNTMHKVLAPVGDKLLGRVLNGMGQAIDHKGILEYDNQVSIDRNPPGAYERKRIETVLETGVRAIDGLLTIGKGQRMGIFSGSGVGKSTLLGMIARESKAEVNVVALIGERGREVREFIEKDLGKEGLKKTVLVTVTGDESPLLRVRGAFLATTIAEYFRDQGKDVLLMMDSVTRLAMAQRELGLMIGEPPTIRGYTPSVFTLLQQLLERTGNSANSGITAFYTVLVEGDDVNEPVSDTVRGILDGHIVLSRLIAEQHHYPAIDILASVSRVMIDIVNDNHLKKAGNFSQMLAAYTKVEDLINIGAYVKGSSNEVDQAIALHDSMNFFLRQDVNERSSFEQTLQELNALFP